MEEKMRIHTTGQYSKRWEDLTFTDNFIFCKVMKDKTLCKELLERLLKIKIERLEFPETEKSLIPEYDSKGIRLDLYVKDSDGNNERIFDVEIQTYKDFDIEKRVRFYQSVIDIDNLIRGDRYKELPESYIIFICTEDPFNLNLPVYETKTMFKNTDTVYNDDTHKIFFNAAAYKKVENKNVRNFLEFIHTHKSMDDFTSKIDKASFVAKQNALWRKEYMFLYDVIEDEKEIAREIGLSEGRAEGARQKAIEAAKNFIRNNVNINIIANSLGLSLEEVRQLQEEMK